MDSNKFYDHVSSWIKSYHNAEAMDWLRKFIENAQQPRDIKDLLIRQIERKTATIKAIPYFCEVNGVRYLMDKEGYPHVFTTRYSANAKLIELRAKGYEVSLVPGDVFFRIKLVQPAEQPAG